MEALDSHTGDGDIPMVESEPVKAPAAIVAAPSSADLPAPDVDGQRPAAGCLVHPAPQEEVPGLSSSSSASVSSAARSPPPVELDFDHPVRHVQPAFFYPTPGAVAADYYVHTRRATGAGARAQDANHGLDADGSLYLDPEEDEECKRGIPVFKPTMEEFVDFEGYMNLVDHWGRRSGIVKVIPPQEWIQALPKIPAHAIADVKIKSPIQQHMQGRAGLFRVNNVERKKPLTVKDWFQKCTSPQYRTPNLHETSRSDRPVTGPRKKEEPSAAPSKPKHPNQWTYRKKAAEAEAAAKAAAAGSVLREDKGAPVVSLGGAVGPVDVTTDAAPVALESDLAPIVGAESSPLPSGRTFDAPTAPNGSSVADVAAATRPAPIPLAPADTAPAVDKQQQTASASSADAFATAPTTTSPADTSSPPLEAAINAPVAGSPLPDPAVSESTYAVTTARKKVVALYTYRPKPIPRPPPLEAAGGAVQAAPSAEAGVQVIRRKQPNQWTYRDRDNSTASTSASAAVTTPDAALNEEGKPVRRKQPNQWTYRDKPKPTAVPASSSRVVMVLDENGQPVRRKQPNQHTYRNQQKPVTKKLPPLVLDADGNWVKRKQPNQHTYRAKMIDGGPAATPSEHVGATFDFVPPQLPGSEGEAPSKRKQPNQHTYRESPKPGATSSASTALTEAALDQQNAATASSPVRRKQPNQHTKRLSEGTPGSPASSALSSTLSSAPALEGEDSDVGRKQPNHYTNRNSVKADSVASSSVQAAVGEAPAKQKQPNQYTFRNLPKPGGSLAGSIASSVGDRGVLAGATNGRDIKPLPSAAKRKQPNQWTYRDSPKVLAAAAAAATASSPAPSASSGAVDAETPARRKQPNQWTYRDKPQVSDAAPVVGQKRKQPNQWTYRNKAPASSAAVAASVAAAASASTAVAKQSPPANSATEPALPPTTAAAGPAAEPPESAVTPPSKDVSSNMKGIEAASAPSAPSEATANTPAAYASSTATLGEQMATIAAALRASSPDATSSHASAVVLENMQVDPKKEVDIAPAATVVAAVDAAEAQAAIPAPSSEEKGPASVVAPVGAPAGDQAGSTVESSATAAGGAPAKEAIETFTSNPAPRKRRKTPPPEEDLDPWYETLLEKQEWMPEGTEASDFTVEACRELERKFWRGLGVGESAWYGADLQGSFFTEETTEWNVAALPNLLNRLKMKRQLPGVNTPYLYWGMWRAAFAWHVEDMDLYSVNYLHFGAPKFWYAVPQAKADALERTMRSYFPSDVSECNQFLRHKSFAASPQRLSQDACRPNVLVQHPNEFVFTFPRGYHSGFNTGFNCAESINFALDSWIDLGRKARYCTCIDDSVRMDVDAILREHQMLADLEEQRNIRAEQERERLLARTLLGERKRPATPQAASSEVAPAKKVKVQPPAMAPIPMPRIILKPPKPVEPVYPCILCASESAEGLLECTAVPSNVIGKNRVDGKRFFAHELCAQYIPETHIIELDSEIDGLTTRRKFIDGVCDIPKDRWNLGCSVCTRPVLKKMGGKVQCDKGKCPRAFHVTCAESNEDTILREFDHTEWVLVSEDPLDTRQVQLTTRKRECVCSSHNPAVKERKKQEALSRQRSVILSYKPYDRIKIRSKSGMIYEVPLIAISSERETVSVNWLDGRSVETPWSTVIDPASNAPKPTANAAKSTAKKSAPATTTQVIPALSRPFDHTRGEQLFRSPGPAPRKFVTSPLDLSDVDPALLGVPWSITPPAFPAPTPGGRSLQISPAVQRLLQKEPTLQALFESVGWPVAPPRPPPAPSGPSAPALAAAPVPALVTPLVIVEASSGAPAAGPEPVTAAISIPATRGEGATQPTQPLELGLAHASALVALAAPAADQSTQQTAPINSPSAAQQQRPLLSGAASVDIHPTAVDALPRRPLAEKLAAPPCGFPAVTASAADQSPPPTPF